MRSWQDRGMPYYGSNYSALTPHQYWDGRMHYWTGMPVHGDEEGLTEDGQPALPALERQGIVKLKKPELESLRSKLKSSGCTHKEAGEELGMGLSRMRERLYGRKHLKRTEFEVLCRLAGIDPAGLIRKGVDEG